MRILVAMVLLSSLGAAAQTCPTRAYWPTDAFRTKLDETRATKAAEIAALDEYMFTRVGADAERKGIRTDGLLILKGGEIIYERYFDHWGPEKRHIQWSVSKTLTMLNVGVAVQKGLVNLDDSICKSYAAKGDICKATFQNLLEMSSGLDWLENYENKAYQESSVLNMFYGEGSKDLVKFVAEHPIIAAPGERFNYSTGESTLLMGALRAVVKEPLGDEYPYTQLFDKLGIKSAAWERDAQGNFFAGSHAYLSLQDMARIGYFMASDGCWNGERLLPAQWMTRATTVNEPFKKGQHDPDDTPHGWHIWLNRAVPEVGVELPWKDVPNDASMAIGHWGQYIAFIPSKDLVVVRYGDDRDASALDENKMLSLAIAVGGTP